MDFSCSLAFGSGQAEACDARGLAFWPDGKKLITFGVGDAAVWNVQTGERLFSFDVMGYIPGLCSVSPCGKYIAHGAYTHENVTLVLLSAADGKRVGSVDPGFDDDFALSTCFSPDGTRVAIGGQSGDVALFTVPELQKLTPLARGAHAGGDAPNWARKSIAPLFLAFAGPETLVVSSKIGAEVWNIATGRHLRTLAENHSTDDTVVAAVSPGEGKFVVTACTSGGGPVEVWETATGARVLQLSQCAVVKRVAWLPSGDAIAATWIDKIKLWSFSPAVVGGAAASALELDEIKVIADRPYGEEEIEALCVAPTGRALACTGSGMGGRFLKVFRAPEPPKLSTLQRQLGELLKTRRGADVTLACGGGEETRAHSLILALRSGTMLRQLEWDAEREGGGAAAAAAEGAGGPRRLEVDGAIEPAILERLLEFLYTDHLDIRTAEEAQHLLFAASFYDVPDLFKLCLPVLEEKLSVENVADTLIAADKYGAPAARLKLAALRFVKEHASEVVGRVPAWRRVPLRLVNELVVFQSTGELPPAHGEGAGAAGAEEEEEEAGGGRADAAGTGRAVRQRGSHEHRRQAASRVPGSQWQRGEGSRRRPSWLAAAARRCGGSCACSSS